MSDMRILHVISTLAPTSGGPTNVLGNLGRAQAAAGHEVTICTTDRGNPVQERLPRHYFDRFHSAGLSLRVFPVLFAALLFSPAMARWLKQSLDGFDVVHVHGLYRFVPTYAAIQARKQNVPYIIRPHGALDPFLYKQSRFGRWAVPLKRLYERLFDIPNLNHASAIHYTAREEMEQAAFLNFRARPVIVPNGIDWEAHSTLPGQAAFRARIGITSDAPLVLFLGRINFKKGLDLLVPSFAQVLIKNPQARLAIVGPDNEGYGAKVRQWCRDQGISEKVIFVDHLGPEEVRQAYVDADVFVLPSYTENFGMTVVEAMACKCPVVISDQVNIWREVKEEGAGLVVGLEPGQIADAICQVLGDKETAEEMGVRGRAASEKRYSWPRIVDQLTSVYQDLIEKKARLQ